MAKGFRLKQSRQGIPMAVILTALKVECKAVIVHIENCFEEVGDQGAVYECGDFNPPNCQPWKVAVVECGQGNLNAANEVHHAISYFDPDIVLFVGIAGGLKDDIAVGDVVASTKVYGYHGGKSGKDYQHEHQ